MKKENFKILAIESSCDETAAAVIVMENNSPVILSNIISSQVDLHAKTGGVVPEVASRAHMEAIVLVIIEALLQSKQQKTSTCYSGYSEDFLKMFANIQDESKKDQYLDAIKYLKQNIDYIAVTVGPGLIGSLLVGYNAAKTIAYALNKPIIPINHIEGHIYSAFSESKQEITFPILSLTVSGGHTSLTLMTDHGKYQNIGATLDDAAGEAFDKVAKLLDLGYPGGPIVSKLASQFRDKKKKNEIIFPRPIMNDGTFNFSFSGLKTAVLQKVINLKQESNEELSQETKEAICAAFEDAVVDVLTTKAMRAVKEFEPKMVILAGGVAANKELRNTMKSKVENSKLKIDFLVPTLKLCGDNAVMIGTAAFYHILKNNITTWDKTEVDSNLEL